VSGDATTNAVVEVDDPHYVRSDTSARLVKQLKIERRRFPKCQGCVRRQVRALDLFTRR